MKRGGGIGGEEERRRVGEIGVEEEQGGMFDTNLLIEQAKGQPGVLPGYKHLLFLEG